jgi:hypothetical protein
LKINSKNWVKELTTIDLLLALLLLQFFQVTRRFFEKFKRKKPWNRVVGLFCLVLKNEKETRTRLGGFFGFFRK